MMYKTSAIVFFAASIASASASGHFAGCELSADCPGGSCTSTLATCNWQGIEDQYSDSGIPCGTVYGVTIDCIDGADPIATTLTDIPEDALKAFQDVVSSTLPIGVDNTAELSDPDNLLGAFLVTEMGQTINATFLDEGACFLNTVGQITWPKDLIPGKTAEEYDEDDRITVLESGKMTIFFPNADSETCQTFLDPVLCPPGDADLLAFCSDSAPNLPLGLTVDLVYVDDAGEERFIFPVDTYVAFFLVPDGFEVINKGGPGFDDLTGKIHFTLEALNVAAENNPGRDITSLTRDADFSTTIDGILYDFSRFTIVTWEDNTNDDFQDTVILIETEPAEPSCRGILNSCGDICCPLACGVCGGCDVDCAAASLAAGVECCPGAIRETDIFCGFADEGCIIADADPCPGGNCELP